MAVRAGRFLHGAAAPSRAGAAAAAIPSRRVDNDRTVSLTRGARLRSVRRTERGGGGARLGYGYGYDDSRATGLTSRWELLDGRGPAPAGAETAARAVSQEACKLSAGTGMCGCCSLEIRPARENVEVFRYSSRSFCFAPPPPIFVEKKKLYRKD